MVLNRDRKVVEVDAPLVTRRMLGAYPRLAVLVLLPSVGRIERDALLDLPALEAVVVDVASESRPEDCDYGMEGDMYRHVHVFRIDTEHPPMVSLPDTLFREGYPVSTLLHSEGTGATVGVSDGRTLTSTREGYEVQTLRFGQGEFAVGDADVVVVEWDERRWGVPEGTGEGSVDLRLPYGAEDIPGKCYRGEARLKSVYVPPTVKVIGEHAFNYCSRLTGATLSGVREIGDCAFQYAGLTEVAIPGSVDRIGRWSFNHCKSLTSMEIREGVQSIGDYAFCLSPLTSVHVPSSVKCMGKNPFSSIPSLTKVTSSSPRFIVENEALIDVEEGRLIACVSRARKYVVPEEIRVIDAYAFDTCKTLESVTISSTVEEIGDNAFESTGLTHVVIPRNVRKIGGWAFNECESLETVELNEGLESIGDSAFQYAPLKTLTIPSTVVSVMGNPFATCKCITLRSNNRRFIVTEKGELVDVEEGRLITYPCNNRAEEYTVSNCVRTIGEWAVMYNRHLKTVRLHKGIEDVEMCAFFGCTNLTSFVIPEGVRGLSGEQSFLDAENLTSLEIPHSLWSNDGIGSGTLMGSAITRICFVIHSEEERAQLQGRTVGGKEMEEITFRLEEQ